MSRALVWLTGRYGQRVDGPRVGRFGLETQDAQQWRLHANQRTLTFPAVQSRRWVLGSWQYLWIACDNGYSLHWIGRFNTPSVRRLVTSLAAQAAD